MSKETVLPLEHARPVTQHSTAQHDIAAADAAEVSMHGWKKAGVPLENARPVPQHGTA
jgi:hypothetical protein